MLTTQPDRSKKISCEFVDDAPTRLLQFDQGTLRHLARAINLIMECGTHASSSKNTRPFTARCRFARPIFVLKVKEVVEVLGMAPEEECESEMFVWVGRAGEQVAVPLAQLQPLSKDQETQEAVGDWLYWVDRGYEL
jgi:hypothetical protein